MEKLEKFVEYILGGMRDDHDVAIMDKVQVLAAADGDGFHVDFVNRNNRVEYDMRVPKKFKKLGYMVRKTIRHETAHIIFEEMLNWDLDGLNQWMMKIEDHRMFMKIQRFWYWNRALRWIKIKMGFSFAIEYGPDDYYDANGAFTRYDNELFCDWFAMKEKVWK